MLCVTSLSVLFLMLALCPLDVAGIDYCASDPCSNSGTCVNQVNGFTCLCIEGFTGDTCDTDIDDCEPSPCSNNGICQDMINGFTCWCTQGFTGDTCNIMGQ